MYMRKILQIAIICTVFQTIQSVHAQKELPANSNFAATESALDQLIQEYVSHETFMGAALIAKGDKVLLKKGYGYANLDWDIPNSPKTKFRIGSVTKQFTAASILLLEERGKLKIDDPVRKYLPESPATWDKVTVFHLLTHSSGIPNYTDAGFYPSISKEPTTPEKLIERFSSLPLEFEPGEKYKYSNSGYAVLGQLIEKVSGQSYAKFVQENLFKPLDMKDTGYDSNDEILKHRASGYTSQNGSLHNASYVNMTVPYAAGALYSTAEDLFKWERGVFTGKLLTADSLKKMTAPFKSNYGLGLCVDTKSGSTTIKHGGAINGFHSFMEYHPAEQLIVVVLANQDLPAPAEIAAKVTAIARGETVASPWQRKEVTVAPAILSSYVGKYKLENDLLLNVSLEDQKLKVQTEAADGKSNQDVFFLSAESNNKFFFRGVGRGEFEFIRNDQGEVSQLLRHGIQATLKGTRQK